MKRKLLDILRILVSFSLLAFLLYRMRDSLPALVETIKGVPPITLFTALAFVIGAVLIITARFRLILGAQSIRMSFIDLSALAFIGYFFNMLLPTSVGGDAIKAYYISKKSDNAMSSFASVFLDRLLGMLAMMTMGVAALFLMKHAVTDPRLLSVLLGLLIFAAILLTALFNKRVAKSFSFLMPLLRAIRVKDKLERMYNTLHVFREHKAVMVKGYLLSLAAQILSFSAVCILAGAMNRPVSLLYTYFAMAIIAIVSMLPSIGGLGVRESGFVLLFAPVTGKEVALALGILWLGGLVVLAIIGGLVYALTDRHKIKLADVA